MAILSLTVFLIAGKNADADVSIKVENSFFITGDTVTDSLSGELRKVTVRFRGP